MRVDETQNTSDSWIRMKCFGQECPLKWNHVMDIDWCTSFLFYFVRKRRLLTDNACDEHLKSDNFWPNICSSLFAFNKWGDEGCDNHNSVVMLAR